MLGAMKGVKMSGLSNAIFELIQTLRVNEIKSAAKFRSLLVWNATVCKGFPHLLLKVHGLMFTQ